MNRKEENREVGLITTLERDSGKSPWFLAPIPISRPQGIGFLLCGIGQYTKVYPPPPPLNPSLHRCGPQSFFDRTTQHFIQDFSKRGNHRLLPTYQETVPITTMSLLLLFMLYNTYADLKGRRGIFKRGEGPPPPRMNPCYPSSTILPTRRIPLSLSPSLSNFRSGSCPTPSGMPNLIGNQQSAQQLGLHMTLAL